MTTKITEWKKQLICNKLNHLRLYAEKYSLKDLHDLQEEIFKTIEEDIEKQRSENCNRCYSEYMDTEPYH